MSFLATLFMSILSDLAARFHPDSSRTSALFGYRVTVHAYVSFCFLPLTYIDFLYAL